MQYVFWVVNPQCTAEPITKVPDRQVAYTCLTCHLTAQRQRKASPLDHPCTEWIVRAHFLLHPTHPTHYQEHIEPANWHYKTVMMRTLLWEGDAPKRGYPIRHTKYGVKSTVQRDQFTNLALVFSMSIILVHSNMLQRKLIMTCALKHYGVTSHPRSTFSAPPT